MAETEYDRREAERLAWVKTLKIGDEVVRPVMSFATTVDIRRITSETPTRWRIQISDTYTEQYTKDDGRKLGGVYGDWLEPVTLEKRALALRIENCGRLYHIETKSLTDDQLIRIVAILDEEPTK